MEWVVTKAFAGKGTKFISVYSSYAAWTTRPRKGTFAVNAIQLVRMIAYLIDHIYVTCGSFTFRQIIGIPMGTDCAPLLANLFLYSYEWRFMRQKTKEKQYDIAAKFNKTGRFIDDLFTLNNDLVMQEYMSHIYPPELLLNKENENDTHTTFLDLDISLTDNKITHALYDKRDDFPFEIVNFPHLDGNICTTNAYGILIGQLIRYANACMFYSDFLARTSTLLKKLLSQKFTRRKLTQKFRDFYDRHLHTVSKYNVPLDTMLADCFSV
jgi:hypothetical protein